MSIESAQESEESVPLHPVEQCEDLAIQLNGNIQSEDVIEWMHGDSDDPGYQLLSDDDFVQLITNPNHTVEDESDEDESEEYQNIPSSGEVKNMLDRCLLWYERQEESTATSLIVMKRVRDLAAAKRFTNLKQLKLDSFIVPSD